MFGSKIFKARQESLKSSKFFTFKNFRLYDMICHLSHIEMWCDDATELLFAEGKVILVFTLGQ